MVSLIKNQILKHLTKFTKNMSPDKINVSTLRGEGELCNLELDEVVLMELLDLPTWLRLTKAICNRVAIKIQWTKLKSQPICVFLDEIVVEMETCPEPRRASDVTHMDSYSATSGGKYGFADRVIDGMYVSINSVIVNFKSFAFYASIQLSRIIVQSKTPTWQVADLRMTRIKDENRGEVLIFKEVDWQTLRIEANALEGVNKNLPTTPLRLIANQSKIRITIKKKLLDCGIIASRLQLNLDDVLWVLTDSQLKAAIVFVNSLKEVIKKSSQQSKLLAMEKVQKQGETVSVSQSSPSHSPQRQPHAQHRTPRSGQPSTVTQLFNRYDVIETSYHFHTGRIDLHLCDESAPEDINCARRVDGGAMQITLYKLCFDHYPYHPSGTDRSHCYRYDENMMARHAWAHDLFASFKDEVKTVLQKSNFSPPTTPTHAPTQVQPQPHRSPSRHPHPSSVPINVVQPAPAKVSGQSKAHGRVRQTRLLESCFVVRMEDFTLYRVSTPDSKRSLPKKFLSSDKRQLLLPPEMSSLHLEYTDYYFPEGIDYPVPHSNLYIVVNPIRLNFDYLTALWMNTFALNLIQKVDFPKDEGPKIHLDFKLDALMPRVIVPSDNEVSGQPDRPEGLQIQISRLTITNCHINGKSSLDELKSTLTQYDKGRLFNTTSFPNDKEDLVIVPDTFKNYASGKENLYINSLVENVMSGKISAGDCPFGEDGVVTTPGGNFDNQQRSSGKSNAHMSYYGLTTDSLKHDSSKDLYTLIIEQFWVEFIGVSSSKSRPVPFVESFPINIWVSQPLLAQHSMSRSSSSSSSATFSAKSDTNNVTDTEEPRTERRHSRLLKQFYSTSDEDEQSTYDETSAHRSQEGTLKLHKQETADFHIVAKVGSKVNVQLNHYQFLFLMRLVERIVRFQTDMEEDTVAIMQTTSETKKICLALALREVEFALIGPPVPEPQSQQPSPLSEDLKDAIFDDPPDCVPTNSILQAPLVTVCADNTEAAYDPIIASSDVSNGAQVNFSSDICEGVEALETAAVAFNKSHSDSEITSHSSSTSSAQNELLPHHGLSASQESSAKAATQMSSANDLSMSSDDFPRVFVSSETGSVSMSMTIIDSPISSSPKQSTPMTRSMVEGKDTSKKDIKKSINNAFTHFSKGFGNLNNKLKQNLLDVSEDSLINSDDWDSMSQKSGLSDDDEEFLVVNMQNISSGAEIPVFDHQRRNSDAGSLIDGASDDKDGDVSSLNTLSSAMGMMGVVSVVTFKLFSSHVVIQNSVKGTVICAELEHVQPCEHGNISLDKFQQLFTAGNKLSV